MRARKVRDAAGTVHGTSKVVINPPCGCGKFGYTGRKVALHAAAIARRDTGGEPIDAYRCPKRGSHVWHIGHRPGWRQQQAQEAS